MGVSKKEAFSFFGLNFQKISLSKMRMYVGSRIIGNHPTTSFRAKLTQQKELV